MLRHRRFYLVLSVPVVLMIGALVLFRSQPDEITISFVGDIMLSRGVQSYLEEFGYDYPYEDVRDLFLQDDLTVGNLECPITDYENAANKAKRFLFKADAENASALKRAGFEKAVYF